MEKIDERDGFGRNMIGNFFWILVEIEGNFI
jgi:hypothetical protein